MKERILRFCKQQNRVSLNEIETITEMCKKELLPILSSLISEGKLSEENGYYIYYRKKSVSIKYPLIKKYSAIIIDTVIRCFCESVNSDKTSHITGIGSNQVCKLYNIFRELIYERQKKLLDKYYIQSPQNARQRVFFNKTVYLYIYNNQVFISDNLLKSPNDVPLNKTERADFTKVYCYLSRNLYHNKNAYNLKYKIAEVLWRRSCSFKDLYFDLKNNLIT